MKLIFTSWLTLTVRALLTVGLGFLIRSGQNTAGLSLSSCEPLKQLPLGYGFQMTFFRQRGWRMMGSSWGIRVFLLTPRRGIVGVFLMVPMDLLLLWAPSGRCSELPLYGEFGMWLLSPGREASSTTHGSVLYTLCVQGPSHPLLYIRGAPMPSCSWRSFPSLWGGLWYPRNAGFISVVVCS